MADPTARELKLIQYLNEAYGKEKQLETVLQAQIKLASAEKTLKKRLQDHHKETKAQSRNIERRIKALGGKADAGPDLPGPDAVSGAVGGVTSVANKALAAAKGPVQALRGTSAQDNLLRNVRDAYWNEAEEIAHYNVIEAAANELGDSETAKLAKEHRRQEQRMQSFLEKQIGRLVKAVVREEIPARERKPAAASSSSRRTRTTSAASSSSGGRKRSTSAASSSGGRKRSTSAAASSSSSRSSSPSRKSASASGSSSRKSTGSRAKSASGTSSRSSGAKKSGSGSTRSRSRASKS